jgi:hypothetical protein
MNSRQLILCLLILSPGIFAEELSNGQILSLLSKGPRTLLLSIPYRRLDYATSTSIFEKQSSSNRADALEFVLQNGSPEQLRCLLFCDPTSLMYFFSKKHPYYSKLSGKEIQTLHETVEGLRGYGHMRPHLLVNHVKLAVIKRYANDSSLLLPTDNRLIEAISSMINDPNYNSAVTAERNKLKEAWSPLKLPHKVVKKIEKLSGHRIPFKQTKAAILDK